MNFLRVSTLIIVCSFAVQLQAFTFKRVFFAINDEIGQKTSPSQAAITNSLVFASLLQGATKTSVKANLLTSLAAASSISFVCRKITSQAAPGIETFLLSLISNEDRDANRKKNLVKSCCSNLPTTGLVGGFAGGLALSATSYWLGRSLRAGYDKVFARKAKKMSVAVRLKQRFI